MKWSNSFAFASLDQHVFVPGQIASFLRSLETLHTLAHT
jgi:hypothetical protein